MLDLIRRSTFRARAWLIATAALLLLTSALEAGHTHGVISPQDNHCSLCQHTISFDKTLFVSIVFILPLLLGPITCLANTRFPPVLPHHFALIRAPPQQPQHP